MSKVSKIKINTPSNKNLYEDREGIVYARVSSKRQEIEGTGLQSQEGRCIDELRRLNVPHIKTFSDSYTGAGDFMNRPEMRALLAYIDDNPHKKFVVIFDDLSRLARDVVFHIKLRREFDIREVILKCLNYNFDDSEEGEFFELIFAGKAQLDRKQNKRQVIQKMRARLDAGYWPFGSKRGYVRINNPIHGKLHTPDGKDSEVLKEVLEGFSSGIYVRKIDACKFLIDNGYWKKNRPERYVYQFAKLLRDPFYAGFTEYEPWGVPRRVGHHEPLISPEVYEINQRRLGYNQIHKLVRSGLSEDFLLRGLIICDCCGGHMTASWSTGNGGKYGFYFCQNRKCKMFRKSINRDVISEGFKKVLNENTLKPEVEKLITVIFDSVWNDEMKNLQKMKSENTIEKSNLQDRIEKLTDMAVSTTSEKLKSAYEQQIEKSMSELEEIINSSLDMTDPNLPYQTALDKAIGFLKNPYKIWESVSLEEKHLLFFFIFGQKIPYSKSEGYQTKKIPSAIRLFEEFVTPVTNDVDPTGLEPATPSLQMRCSTR